MIEKIHSLLKEGTHVLSYYWKGFLVRTGFYFDPIDVKHEKIPGSETKAGYSVKITLQNQRTGERNETRGFVFSQEVRKIIHAGKCN